MLIKPVRDTDQVLTHIGPAVRSAFLDDQLGLDSGCLQLVEDQLGLLYRHQHIGVAMDDQGGRVVGRRVIGRADLAPISRILASSVIGRKTLVLGSCS